jgi:hypothetical protein
MAFVRVGGGRGRDDVGEAGDLPFRDADAL